MKFMVAGLAVTLGLVLCVNAPRAGDGTTIKDVMKKAHNKKTGLLFKVAGGTASDDEKKELYKLYVALSKQKPPKGDEADWKERTGKMVSAAKAAETDAKAAKTLTKLANCGACHGKHK
jgi:hypothetical protein